MIELLACYVGLMVFFLAGFAYWLGVQRGYARGIEDGVTIMIVWDEKANDSEIT